MTRRLGLVVALLALACADGGGEDILRGDPGKADLAGSCQGVANGDASPDGCYCDDDCYVYGDCCSDKIAIFGQDITFTTYNAGLVDAVGMVEQRRQPTLDALRENVSDVMCMQEVWSDEDAQRIADELADVYPHSFRQITEADENSWFACKPWHALDLYGLNSCVSDKCSDVSLFECIANQCASEYDELVPECQLCLSANSESPMSCFARAEKFANDGRNGLLLLSRMPIDEPRYTEFPTHLIKRGVITAKVRDFQVQCTHLTADLGRIPYPEGQAVSSWAEEHLSQAALMAEAAGDQQCTILFGDLNTGPEGEGIEGELADNYDQIVGMGYLPGDDQDVGCTHCASNPMVGGSHSSRIDHVLLKNCDPAHAVASFRSFDEPITIVNEGRELESRYSDHYGVTAVLSLFANADLE
ncbi:MAG: endonuclease/exonuclease/phosphatase family protein [Deltaproteobacteria bacterium]|jgi:endonuclease/exonuclease/phosphatase family metal-dependent hydrolase|nr:endonuclease/exonuclease/phosphatase family protein [Deltaproteobacteria bacterium]